MLDKVDRIIMLKDFYGQLLTERQQDVISYYYENDWSLAEIADNLDVSRQAVYDLIRRAEASLENYEKRLGFLERFKYSRQHWQQVYDILDKGAVTEDKRIEALGLVKELKDWV